MVVGLVYGVGATAVMTTKLPLSSGRAVCPACGAKGLGYAAHPHALGYKDYDHARCRHCHTKFKIHPVVVDNLDRTMVP